MPALVSSLVVSLLVPAAPVGAQATTDDPAVQRLADGLGSYVALVAARGTDEQLAAVAWVPTTAWSILAQLGNGTILKLITEARRSNFFLANGTHLPDSTGECVPVK